MKAQNKELPDTEKASVCERMMKMTENELIQGLRNHDESAIEEIMERFTHYEAEKIYNVSRGNLSAADIEETAADVFLVLWNHSDKVREGSLRGYLASIAKSRAKDKMRSTSRHGEVLDIDDVVLADEYSISDNLDNQTLQKDLTDAMNSFGEPDREILLRYYYYYQTAPKIAEVMSMKLEAVKSKIKRGRTKLKAFLTERGY